MKKLHLSAWALGGLLIAATFASCKKDKFENNDNTDVAGLMAFNLAPEKSVSFTISGNWINNTPLAYSSYTGGYLSIYPGTRPVASYDYASGDTLASTSFAFDPEKYYSVFAIGGSGSFQNVIVQDNFDSLSTSNGQAYVRYINAIVGSANPAVRITAGGNEVVNTGAPYASVSDFIPVAPGPIDISVTEGAGINATRNISVEGNKVYTILLISGNSGADPAQIKYITNGTLTGDASEQRTSSATQVITVK